MIDTEKNRTAVTHTQTLPNGSVIVITDVPAYVFEEDGEEETIYDMDVALKIDDFAANCLEAGSKPGQAFVISYKELDLRSSVDVQVRMMGYQVNYGEASTKVWKDALDKIHGSINALRRVYGNVFNVKQISLPVIKTVGAGSLMFGLRARKPSELFEDFTDSSSPEVRILQLLIDGYDLAIGASVKNELINNYPEIAIAALDAIERLSPSGSVIEQVQVIPNERTLKRKQPVSLTSETGSEARERRTSIQLGLVEKDFRRVKIIGQVFSLSRDGELFIKNVEYNEPGVKLYNTKATFPDELFEELAELFKHKKRILFTGIERRIDGDWSSVPEIRYVEEAPDLEGEAEE